MPNCKTSLLISKQRFMKKNKLILPLISLVLFVVLILFQYYAPKPVDWRMSFDRNHKAPYGCYVLNKMYPELFPEGVIYNNETLYENPLLLDSSLNKNFVIITDNFFPDKADLKTLTDFVKAGNSVFISANNWKYTFLDSLKIPVENKMIDTAYLKIDKDIMHFYSPTLESDSGFVFQKRLINSYFNPKDSCNAFLLGFDRNEHVNFVRFDIGKGSLFLHSQPLAFTNIHVLYSTPEYAITALSFLPKKPTIIDRYYKPFRIEDKSPTQFLLAHKPLQIAFYIVVFMLLIYMVFGSRRTQKSIPVVEPLKNTSLEFIQTVGRLYFKSENHANIAQKKTLYFKDFLREKYYITEFAETDKNIATISAKTGVNMPLVRRLVRKINYYPNKISIDSDELISYNKDIEEFINTCL